MGKDLHTCPEALNVMDRLQCYLQNNKHITMQRINFLKIFTLYQYLNPKVSKMAIPEYILTNPFLFNFMTVLSFQFRWTIKRNAIAWYLCLPLDWYGVSPSVDLTKSNTMVLVEHSAINYAFVIHYKRQ